MDQSILLEGARFGITIQRLCRQLIERHGDFANAALIGIQPRGTYLARRIHREIEAATGRPVRLGIMDITFHRDDFRTKGAVPLAANSTEIDFVVDGKQVVLIDDVLWTGRTIRAAMDAVQAFGRPDRMELLVLVDRRFSRQIPIQPDYTGIQVDSIDSQRVIVSWEDADGADSVTLVTEKQ